MQQEPDQAAAAVGVVYDVGVDLYLERIGVALSVEVEAPADLRAIDRFATMLRAGPPGIVVDAGCGPGRAAARLVEAGLPVLGIDVAAAMLAAAQVAHPALPLARAELAALPLRDGAAAGIVAWYSVIHTSPERLGPVIGELVRVVRPGGHVLVAFQAGAGEAVRRADAHGSGVALTSHRHDPDVVAAHLAAAGLDLLHRLVRAPERAHETTPQAVLHARRPDPTR